MATQHLSHNSPSEGDEFFTKIEYHLALFQDNLIEIFSSNLTTVNCHLLLENQGYFSGVMQFLDFCIQRDLSLEENKKKTALIEGIQHIQKDYIEKDICPSQNEWKKLQNLAHQFKSVEITLSVAQFKKTLSSSLLKIKDIIHSEDKITHMIAYGIASGIMMTSYFDQKSAFAQHMRHLHKALEVFATNPCPVFDPQLQASVIKEIEFLLTETK